MTKYFSVLFIGGALALGSCAKEAKVVAQKVDSAKVEQKTEAVDPSLIHTASLSLPTTKCGSCAKTIKGAVGEIEGVTEVSVDPKAHTGEVKFISTKTNVNVIEKKIAAAGYDVNTEKRDPKAYEALHECCK